MGSPRGKPTARRLVLSALLAACVATGGGGFADTTSVTDTVAVAYHVSGQVIMLGLSGGNYVDLLFYGGSVWAPEAGARAVEGSGGYAASTGGRLKYTLFRVGTCKITVQTTRSDFVDGSLSVKAMSIGTGGSGNAGDIQGSPSSPGLAGYVPIKCGQPMDFITGIDGANTYTGTNSGDGVWIKYRLDSYPGAVSGSTLPVLYTILQS